MIYLDDKTTAGRIALVGGTGGLGYGLALRLARAGAEVTIGSRDERRAQEAAAQVCALIPDATVDGADNAAAVRSADVVFLCVPFANHAAVLRELAPSLSGTRVLVDATVPLATALGGRPTQVLGVWHGSAAEQAQALVPDGVSVVAGLHTVAASTLSDLEHALDEHVLLCGDDKPAKEIAQRVIGAIPGLRCVDCGRLDGARLLESLTPLLIRLNGRYRTHAGIRITGLPAPLGVRAAAP